MLLGRLEYVARDFLDQWITVRSQDPEKLGERLFSYAGPFAWNNLPMDIRLEQNCSFTKHP